MALLWDKYKSILDNRADWCYYRNFEYQFENSIFTNEHSANNFIRKYFEAGGKEVFWVGSKDLGSPHERNLHTVSLYFLGLFFAKELGVNKFASRNYMKELNETKDKRFLFDWYLTCLYHDIGYRFEEKSKDYTNAETLSSFLEQNTNRYTKRDSLFCSKGLFYKNKKLYDLCDKYYSYKYHKFKNIDHGIVGGIILYDKLFHNYYNIKKTTGANNDSFLNETNSLCYSTKLFANYKNAAKAILKHNMWVANAETIEEYINDQLFELIPKNLKSNNILKNYCDDFRDRLNNGELKGEFTKYGLKDKLTFLLCLADTLEPIKSFKDKPENILNNIDMTISKNIIKIIVRSKLSPDNYFNKIKGLEEWMNVKVIDSSNYYHDVNDKSDLKIIFEQTV